MKILIVDDHGIVRLGLKQILADEFPAAAFGEAGNTTEALQLAHQSSWDVVLLDINLPGRGGLEVLDEFKVLHPMLPILILSMNPEAEFAERAIKSGAAGYLTKQSAAEELIGAIRKVLAGGRYISSALAEQLAANLAGEANRRPHHQLSNRELQTLLLLAEGKSVKEIGAHLGLSGKTVSTYRSRVLEKLGLKSTVELARYALANQLIK